MPEDKFPVEVVRGVPVVAAPEEIDITNAEALRAALLAAADGHGTLVVDMTRTRFCDSSGLHVLIAAHRRAGAEGRAVLLVIPGTAVLRVFALTGMDAGDAQLHQPGRGPGASARRRERPRASARRRGCPCRRPGGAACQAGELWRGRGSHAGSPRRPPGLMCSAVAVCHASGSALMNRSAGRSVWPKKNQWYLARREPGIAPGQRLANGDGLHQAQAAHRARMARPAAGRRTNRDLARRH